MSITMETMNLKAKLRRQPIECDYRGLSYEECNKLALKLISVALWTENWSNLPAHLLVIERYMRMSPQHRRDLVNLT